MPFEVGHEAYKLKSPFNVKPKKSKNLLPIIRDRVLQSLERRLSNKNIVEDIPTTELLKFAQSIMPKDLSIRLTPNIEYISSTPRPQSTLDIVDVQTLPSPNPSSVSVQQAMEMNGEGDDNE